jgi:hypothetical protein
MRDLSKSRKKDIPEQGACKMLKKDRMSEVGESATNV